MRFLFILALAVATATAFDLRGKQIIPRQMVAAPVERPEGRITNGENATSGQFPYQVGLLLESSQLMTFWCGGSLISNEWVLTAAHCTDNIIKITVYLGATNRSHAEVEYSVYASDFVVHSEWDRENLLNDIALIKIPATPFTSTIQPVKLPAISGSYSTYAGDDAIASGWGKTSDAGQNVPEVLQYAEMPIVSNRVCADYYGYSFIKPSHLCVETPGGVSTCNGDSGGPLVLSTSGIQVGLTSFGARAGCELGHPAAFTRVTSYLDWIQKYTNVPN